MAAWNVALVAILLGLSFAGCIGETQDAPDGATTPGRPAAGPAAEVIAPAEPPAPTKTTGAVAGEVYDHDLEPVHAAFISIATGTADRAARSDADGRFTINDLPPGRYPLQVSAIGYGTVIETVAITAGDISEAVVLLQKRDVPVPYSVPYEMRGFMASGFAAMDGEFAGSPDLGDPNHNTQHPFDVSSDGLETVLVELHWDAAQTGLAVDVWKNVTCNPCTAVYAYANEAGYGSIKIRLDRPTDGWQGITAEKETLWLFVWPTSDDDHPATVAYQLAYDVFVEAFYHEPAPFNYWPRGDQ